MRLGGLSDAPFTPLALEGLFSSVSPDGVVKGGGASKGMTTVAALGRPVTGVHDRVLPQL